MLNDEFLKNCFGSDDDDEDEKFEIKHKKERKVAYHPNADKSTNKRKNKNKGKNQKTPKKNLSVEKSEKLFHSDSSLIPIERKISLDISKFKIKNKKYHIEYDYGNVEYKLKLCDVNIQRIQELTSQMNFRLREGGGECYYEIGVEDNGNALGISKQELEMSLSVINTIAINLGCQTEIKEIIQGKEGLIAEMYIKKQEENLLSKIEITIGVLGEEGSGKSTIIGVLINGILDNGDGLARQNVFRHKHEIFSGKTSSFSHQILGFDGEGKLINYGDLLRPSKSQIVNKSSKIINFYDMAGGNKTFNRTTLSTLSNEYLDYLLFVISCKEEITKNMEDLLAFMYNVDLPVITIINKIDLISNEDLEKFVRKYKETIKKLNKELNLEKIPIIIKNDNDVELFSRSIDKKEIMVTFLVSALKWEGGLTLFKNYLRSLPKEKEAIFNIDLKKKQKELERENMEFDIHEIIYKETNAILIGIVSSGELRTKSKYYLGPDSNGNFKVVEACDIFCKKVAVNYSYKGQYCSISIKSLGKINTLTRENVKKGMSLLDMRINPIASRLFEIEIWTIDDTTKILKNSYQPILNIKHIRQGVKIKNYDDIFLFLSDNKKQNVLETLIEDDDINLSNVQEKINNLIKKKKSRIKIENKENIENEFKNNNNNNKNDIVVGPIDKKTKLIVEFLFNPEYISIGQKIIISDQSLKAYGVITKIFK